MELARVVACAETLMESCTRDPLSVQKAAEDFARELEALRAAVETKGKERAERGQPAAAHDAAGGAATTSLSKAAEPEEEDDREVAELVEELQRHRARLKQLIDGVRDLSMDVGFWGIGEGCEPLDVEDRTNRE